MNDSEHVERETKKLTAGPGQVENEKPCTRSKTGSHRGPSTHDPDYAPDSL
jgi:hypothetical protein